MTLKAENYVSIFVLLFAIGYGIVALGFKEPDAKGLPLALALIVSALSALQVGRELKSMRKSAIGKAEALQAESPVTTRRFLVALGWAAGFAIAIYVFGFLISMPVFTVVYLRARRRAWLVSIAIAVCLTAAMYGGFVWGAKVPLHEGIIARLWS